MWKKFSVCFGDCCVSSKLLPKILSSRGGGVIHRLFSNLLKFKHCVQKKKSEIFEEHRSSSALIYHIDHSFSVQLILSKTLRNSNSMFRKTRMNENKLFDGFQYSYPQRNATFRASNLHFNRHKPHLLVSVLFLLYSDFLLFLFKAETGR
jgi:hypothetical protein